MPHSNKVTFSITLTPLQTDLKADRTNKAGLMQRLEGLALRRFTDSSSTHMHSEPRLGKQGGDQGKSFTLLPVQSFIL